MGKHGKGKTASVIWVSFADDPLTSTVVTLPAEALLDLRIRLDSEGQLGNLVWLFQWWNCFPFMYTYQLILESDCSWDPPQTIFQV